MNEKYSVAVINVLTMDDENELNKHGRIIESYFTNIKTTSFCIEGQYSGVYDDETHEKASIKVVKLGKEIYKGFDAIVVSCAGDPGVEDLRKEVDIPVIGAGHSVSSFGINIGHNIGVIGIRKSPSNAIKRSLGDNLSRYIKPDGITNANDLLTYKGQESLFKSIYELESCGVDAIVLACTGISTLCIDKYLNEKFSLPIVDPVYALGSVLINTLEFNKNYRK